MEEREERRVNFTERSFEAAPAVTPLPAPFRRGATYSRGLNTKAQTRDLRNLLTTLANDEGVLEVPLLARAMSSIGLAEFSDDYLTNELLSTDKDGDGKLEVHEFDTHFKQLESLSKAGIEGALEPWDLGRSLAIDALPLAVRSFTAHAAVDEAILESEARLEPSPQRRASVVPRGSRSSSIVGSPPASPPPSSAHDPLQMAALPQRNSEGSPSGRRRRAGAPPNATAPLCSFTVWEETKTDFAEYKALRTAYEQAWPNRTPRHRRRGAPALSSHSSAPALLPAGGRGRSGTPAQMGTSSIGTCSPADMDWMLHAARPPTVPHHIPSTFVTADARLDSSGTIPRPMLPRGTIPRGLSGSATVLGFFRGQQLPQPQQCIIRGNRVAADDPRPRSSVRSLSHVRGTSSHARLHPPRMHSPRYTSVHAAAAEQRRRHEFIDMSTLLCDTDADAPVAASFFMGSG